MKEIIINYLKTMELKFSHSFVGKQLLSHPDYPSILSASDVLEQLGLEVQVGRIGEKHLSELPFPYLLHTENSNSGFLLVESEHTLTEEKERLQTWEGVILKAEIKNGYSNPEHEKAYKEEKFKAWAKYSALSGLGILLLLSFLSVVSIATGIYLTTALLGLLLGYILIAKDLGVKYAAVESFCGAGAANHCDKVLTSEYSKIFGIVTFSDLVLTYFAVQTMVAGFIIPSSGNALAWWAALAGLAGLSIPAIFYSVYYQWAKIQAWCRLCLLVVGVLTLQIGFFSYTFLNSLFTSLNPGGVVLGTTLLLFVGVGSVVIWLKDLIKSEELAIQAEAFSNRIKYDPNVFSQYLLEQRTVGITPFEKEISIGNPEAPIRLVMASNLFCNPCKAMHEKLNKLVQVWPDKMHVSFQFLPVNKKNEGDTDPREVLLNYWLKNIYGSESPSTKTQLIIQDWFERESIDAFMGKYATNLKENHELMGIMELQNQWIKKAEITKTPTLFLNGFEFPQQYVVEDLMSMVPGLVDYFQHENKFIISTNKASTKEIA